MWKMDEAIKQSGKYTDQEVSALEDSLAVEHGSNENGEYWRWENGLQITRGSDEKTLDFVYSTHNNGTGMAQGWYRPGTGYMAAFLPADHLVPYVVLATPSTGGRALGDNVLNMFFAVRSKGTSDFQYVVSIPAGIQELTYTIDFLTVGRWK